jgi:hypothetical protein
MVLYTAALRSFASGHYDVCAELLRCVAARSPHDAAPYFWLAKACAALGQQQAAMDAASMCVELLAACAAGPSEHDTNGAACPSQSMDCSTFTRQEAIDLYSQFRHVMRRRKGAAVAGLSPSRVGGSGGDSLRSTQIRLQPRSITERALAIVTFICVIIRILFQWVIWGWKKVRPSVTQTSIQRRVLVPLWVVLGLCILILLLLLRLASARSDYTARVVRPTVSSLVEPPPSVQWVFVPFLFY